MKVGRVAAFVVLGTLGLGSGRAWGEYALYVSEMTGASGGRVVRVDAAGQATTFAEAGLNRPSGLAFDAAGNLYVANVGDNSVRLFTPTGAGPGLFASRDLNGPYGLAFDAAGHLFVANAANNSVAKFDAAGAALGKFDAGVTPTQIAFDAAGNLLVADLNAASVRRFSTTGQDLGVAAGRLDSPFGIAIDRNGDLFVSELYTGRIRRFASDGTDLGVFADAGLSQPSGLAIDGDGNLYVVNNNGGVDGFVRKFSSRGDDLGIVASGLSGATFLAIGPSLVGVPEPGSLALTGLGVLAVAAACWRRVRAGRSSSGRP